MTADASAVRALVVRRERPEDRDAVARIHDAAFGAADGARSAESLLVDRLRVGPGWIAALSLVAVVGDEVVGHVVCSQGTLSDDRGAPVGSAVGLGPIGVRPDVQAAGIGSAMVYAAVGAAQALDVDVVCLLGAPAYYGRFGFVASSSVGITPPDPAWGAFFQALPLSVSCPQGDFRYDPAFDGI